MTRVAGVRQGAAKKAQDTLGPRFDIRRFHDAVLLAGPLPLDLLETRIEAWIAREKAAEATPPGT